jgi:hypothetical protein
MKLKMFLMLWAISVAHKKMYHINIIDLLEPPFSAGSYLQQAHLATATALWEFNLEKNL